jgi:hypothetical protein
MGDVQKAPVKTGMKQEVRLLRHGCQAYTVDRYVSMMYRD